MKLNKIKWEQHFLIRDIAKINNYDLLYTDLLKNRIQSQPKSALISIDLRNQTEMDSAETLIILKLFSHQKPRIINEKGRFKLRRSTAEVTLRKHKLYRFLYYLLLVIYPVMVSKQISFSKTCDEMGQLHQTISEINVYLRIGVKQKIYEWNKNLGYHLQFYSNNALSQECGQFFEIILQ